MFKKVVIIDDELLSLNIIEKFCSRFKSLDVIGKFNKSIEGFEFIENNEVDLIILDVEMPIMNGLDLVMNLSRDIPVIVMSSEKKYAFDFIKYQFVIAYLHKPINEIKFEEIILKFFKSEKNNIKSNIVPSTDNYLFINVNKCLKRLEIKDIRIIESRADYVYIKTKTQNYITKSTLKNIEKKLPENFFRTHKSFIVNIDYIGEINNGVIIIGDEYIPLSKSNSKEFYDKINRL